MKRTIFFVAIVFGLASADVIPMGSHFVCNEVFITNACSIPEYRLIGYIRTVQGSDSAYLIEDSVRLYNLYKFNELSLYAIRGSLLDSCGGVQGLDFQALRERLTGARININPSGTSIEDAIPLVKDTYFYRIESVNSRTLILKLVKRIMHYSDGRNDEIEEY